MSSLEEAKGVWKQQIGAAKIMWGKLTEDELLKTEGHEQKLAGLIQEHYAIGIEVAEEQAKKFLSEKTS